MRRSKATSTAERAAPPHSTQYRFIGGKGGVGKTTCAAALGIVSAARGSRTLVISTDPAPSLGDALQQPLTARPRAVRGVPRLHAMEVDAPAALAEYLASRRSTLEEIALRGTWLDRDDVSRLLQLSLPGIDEIAGLLQIAGISRQGRYEQVIVDTAPTGHLLRLLGMPAVFDAVAQAFDHLQARHRIVVESLRGSWTGDAADALIDEISRDAGDLASWFRDPGRARVSWVTLPELMAVEETSDALAWLASQAIAVDAVIVNRLTTPPQQPCSWCSARRDAERIALEVLRKRTGSTMPITGVPAAGREPRGVRLLTAMGQILERRVQPRPARRRAVSRGAIAVLPRVRLAGELPAIAGAGTRLVMFGGKGGVGKTTCAAAAALELARASRQRRVLLISVDPAHSVGDALGGRFGNMPRRLRGGPPNLMVRELDAAQAFGALRGRLTGAIDELFGRASGAVAGSMTTHDRQDGHELLDLAPPGIDELVAVLDVTEALVAPTPAVDLVVMDTAPTGHALRLIEMPTLAHAWVKALMAILLKYQPVVGLGQLGAILLRLSKGLGRLRELMTDPRRTRFVAVTRAAALPRAETARLLDRLTAASIHAPIVIVNALGAGTCSRCRRERQAQGREVTALLRGLPAGEDRPPVVAAARAEIPAPHGHLHLREWRDSWRRVYHPQPS